MPQLAVVCFMRALNVYVRVNRPVLRLAVSLRENPVSLRRMLHAFLSLRDSSPNRLGSWAVTSFHEVKA